MLQFRHCRAVIIMREQNRTISRRNGVTDRRAAKNEPSQPSIARKNQCYEMVKLVCNLVCKLIAKPHNQCGCEVMV